jgi:hypothetical protein
MDDNVSGWSILGIGTVVSGIAWIHGLRAKNKELELKSCVADEVERFLALGDRGRERFSRELSEEFELYQSLERKIIRKLEDRRHATNRGLWQVLKDGLFFSAIGQDWNQFNLKNGRAELSASHWVMKKLRRVHLISSKLHNLEVSARLRDHLLADER